MRRTFSVRELNCISGANIKIKSKSVMTTQHRSRTKAAKIEDLVVGQKTKVAEFNITSGSLVFEALKHCDGFHGD